MLKNLGLCGLVLSGISWNIGLATANIISCPNPYPHTKAYLTQVKLAIHAQEHARKTSLYELAPSAQTISYIKIGKLKIRLLTQEWHDFRKPLPIAQFGRVTCIYNQSNYLWKIKIPPHNLNCRFIFAYPYLEHAQHLAQFYCSNI